MVTACWGCLPTHPCPHAPAPPCSYYSLKPDIKVIAPWREWDLLSRTKLIEYAEKNGIPVPSVSGGGGDAGRAGGKGTLAGGVQLLKVGLAACCSWAGLEVGWVQVSGQCCAPTPPGGWALEGRAGLQLVSGVCVCTSPHRILLHQVPCSNRARRSPAFHALAEQARRAAVLHGRQPAAHQLRGQRAGGPVGHPRRVHVHALGVAREGGRCVVVRGGAPPCGCALVGS